MVISPLLGDVWHESVISTLIIYSYIAQVIGRMYQYFNSFTNVVTSRQRLIFGQLFLIIYNNTLSGGDQL